MLSRIPWAQNEPAVRLLALVLRFGFVKIERTGTWLYGERVELSVDIVSMTFDYWHQIGIADGEVGPDEEAQPLGDDGLLYYVRFRKAGSMEEPTWVDSGSYQTVHAAMLAAELKASSAIIWS